MNKLKFSRIILIVIITISILFNACTIPRQIIINEDCVTSSTNQKQKPVDNQVSSSVNVKINIDGTPSMEGFVNTPDSRYIQILKAMDNVAVTAFGTSKVEYYKFGLAVDKLEGEKSSLKAQKKNFYNNQVSTFRDAQLQPVITPLQDNRNDELTIILTDLYQKESSTEAPVIQILRDKYLNQGYAVGILGVKSEFKGTVYDINLKGDSKPNQTTNSHPFYIMLLGKYANIRQYYENLKQNVSFLNDDNFTIFSKQLVERKPVLNIETNSPKLPRGIQRLLTANKNGVIVKFKSPESTERLLVKGKSNAKIEYKADYYPLPYTLSISSKDIVHNIEPIQLREKKELKQLNVNVSDFRVQNNKIKWNLTIGNSIKPGVYAFAINAIPKQFQEPAWWKEWSFEEKEFDVTKTYNLRPFLTNLSNVTLGVVKSNQSQAVNQHAIGRFCYVLQK